MNTEDTATKWMLKAIDRTLYEIQIARMYESCALGFC
jgi:hypothetical protein